MEDTPVVVGYISSGTNTERWIALGKTTGEMYAANLTDQWMVFDGPLAYNGNAETYARKYVQRRRC